MSKKQDRIRTTGIICEAARLYKSNLVGKKFLYLFDNRYIEVIYKKNGFKHLTGVDTYLTANEFYKLAVKGQITEKQIYFSSKHPFSLCQRKLKHLKEISNLAVAESFILEEIHTDTKTYKFGTTDLNFSLCFNQDYDHGVLINEVFHVESLRDECCCSRSSSVYDVSAIFCKENTEKLYNHFIFLDSMFSLENLPDEVKKLCSDDFLLQLEAETGENN